jgi:ELWxxDGT repeat protein
MKRLLGTLGAFAVLPFLAPAPVLAQAASLVRAIGVAGPPPAPASSSPNDFFATDSALFFVASTPSTLRAMWATDGTSVGTELLHYPCVNGCDVDPTFVGHLGKVAFWLEAPSDLTRPNETWRSDGTRAGTFKLFPSGPFSPGIATPSGFLFVTCADAGCGYWLSDGTVAGTRQLLNIFQFTSETRAFAASLGGNRLLLAVTKSTLPGSFSLDLWVSDGTSAGSSRVASFPNVDAVTPSDGHMFFVVVGSGGQSDQLWASDGTVAGTRQVTAFPDTIFSPFGDEPRLLAVGDRLFFMPIDGTSSNELWTSDGTPAGTVRITPGTAHAYGSLGSIVAVGSRTFFLGYDDQGGHLYRTDGTSASTAVLAGLPTTGQSTLFSIPGRVLVTTSDLGHGAELWSTDGTDAGTFPLDVPNPGPSSSYPGNLQAFGTGALFNATDASGQRTLWYTDGTVAGTHRFASVALADDGGATYHVNEVGAFGGAAYFPAQDSHGVELWKSDGKSGGTALFADLAVAQPTAKLGALTAALSHLFFTADDGARVAPWQSDGTPAGTVPVPTASPVDCKPIADSPRLATASGVLFFACQGPGDSLFRVGRSDGTAAGTTLLPLPAETTAPGIASLGSDLLILLEDEGELWKSDGTAAGTVQVKALPGFEASSGLLTALGPETYFDFYDAAGHEIWRTDGTSAGTRRLFAESCSPNSGETSLLTRVGSQVYILSRDCIGLANLWVTDGTTAGTHLATPLSVLPLEAVGWGGRLYFTVQMVPYRGIVTLYQSDGTAAGTAEFHRFNGVSYLTPFAGRLFFSADDGIHGFEPWSTDGTPAGTALFRDLLPGIDPSGPTDLTVAGDRLFFTADDGVHGIELWQSDGNAANPAGTHLVQDIAPEGRSSRPDQLTVAGDRLYFTADDGLSGRALWALPLASPTGCQPGDTALCLAGNRFRVEIAWQDFQGNTGVGHAVSLTADTGYFWFFDPANTEVIVKVLDARTLNHAFWVFYGALSNVEYTMTVTDTTTGLTRRYQNPAGNLASVGDTAGFGPLGAFAAETLKAPAAAPAWVSARTDAAAATGVCVPGPQRLCLQGNRFAVTAIWKDFQGNTGTGTAVPLSGDTGYFWFFAPTNVEVVTKVLDGRALGGKFWFFYGALSNVEYTLTVTDTQTGAVKTYKNPSGQFGSVADTAAF